MKHLIVAVVAALLASDRVSAAEPGVGAEAALACTKAPDAPLCLLGLLGQQHGGVMQIHDYVFFGRRDLLAKAGITDERAEAWIERTEGPRALSPEQFAINRAVRDVVELSAGGATPEQALAPVEALDFSDVPDAQLYAYGMLANFHGVKGEGLKPSRELVALALARWEAVMQDRPPRHFLDDMGLQLASAYARIGDAAGAERAIAFDKRKQNHWSAVEHLTAQRRWEAAVEAARPTEAKYELVREIGGYRRVLVNQAIAAGRPDIALQAAEHILQAEADFARSAYGSQFALPIVHRYAPERTAYWAERLENAEAPPLALAAHWGWMAVGRPDRARQITDRWLPVAREAKIEERWGEGGISEVQEMLLAERRMGEMEWFGMYLPHQFIEMDLNAGRGIGRLDEYLALTGTLDERRMVLETCTTVARSLERLQEARTCAIQLIEVNPLQGSLRALEIVPYAARLGQPELMREMVLVGLRVYERLPPKERAEQRLHQFQQSALETYVAAEIAERPRS